MLSQLRPAVVTLGFFAFLTGIAYPLAMTAIAGAVFPNRAAGSLIERDGKLVGSSLIGQNFAAPGYLRPRPSAAGEGYDGGASSGTNLAPTSAKLADRLKTDAEALFGPDAKNIPADAITTSGSGLDPHISPQYALSQVPRIATARGLTEPAVQAAIERHTQGRDLGIFGEPRVNVLLVNLALDEAKSPPAPAAPPAEQISGK